MGRGSSGLRGGGGGGTPPAPVVNTPSGVTYDQFMQMSDDQKYQTMNNIISDQNIQVPNYLDPSTTSKILYGLGMNNKPTVVSDTQLDSMQGREIFRTVYESGSLPPPTSADILDQIRNEDYTQMSGSGGSAHGRALYFATDFTDSRVYGDGERNATMMRAKINPNARIVSETNLNSMMSADASFQRSSISGTGRDAKALYAISHGIDGWYSGTYTMMVNRGVLTASNQNKSISTGGQTKTGRLKNGSNYASSWGEAMNVN